MSTTGRAVLYARLSKDLLKEGAGVSRQLDDARTLAKMRGFNIVGEFSDNDTSAAGTKKRPEFEAMMTALSEGQATVVIAWAWDRLSRNRTDTLRLIELGQEKRLTVALVRGTDIDMATASGRLVADLLAGVARAEIDQKSERQQRASRQRAEAGHPPSRRAFGYNRDGSVHPTEGPAVTETFALFLAGNTQTGLAKRLNDAGLFSTRGKRWEDTGIRVMLTNPRYVGERHYHGERIAEGTWQPLVSAETFQAVQAVMSDPARKKRRAARRYLGSSLYKCHCGATVKVSYDGSGTRVYVCTARRHMQRKADPVDDLVCEVISGRLRMDDVAEVFMADPVMKSDVAKLRETALGYRERLDGLGRDYAEGTLTAAQVRVATQTITQLLADVENQLADAGKTSALASIAHETDLGAAWLGLPLDRQRAVLESLVQVVLLPGRVGRGAFDPATVRFDWTAS